MSGVFRDGHKAKPPTNVNGMLHEYQSGHKAKPPMNVNVM